MGRLLQLNFTPVRLDGSTIQLQTVPFKDSEQFRSLRDQYREQHAVTRRGDHIAVLPLAANSPVLGAESQVPLTDGFPLIRSLLESRLISLLSANRRPVVRYSPVTTVGRTLPTGFVDVDRHVQLQTRVLIAIRSLKTSSALTLGLLWDMEIQKSCATTLRELHEGGLRLDGLVVERRQPMADPRMLSSKKLVGRVGGIVGDMARLSERFNGVEEFLPLDDLYLEASPENLRRLLQHFARNGANRAQAKIDEIVFDNSKGHARMEHIARISGWVRGLGGITLQAGLVASVGELIDERDSAAFPFFFEASTPTYVFDAGTLKSASQAAAGLTKYGPYSRHVFTPTKPNICVICDRKRRGQFELFLRKLRDGLTVDGRSLPFGRGLLGIYGLHDLSLTFVEADGFTAEAYHAAAAKALRLGVEGSPWHLALVQTEKDSRQLAPKDNPYLVAKAAFLSNQIPTQFIACETFAMPPINLAYTLSNLALAVYAKLGGIPWLIKSDKGIAHEVVIGLGSAAIGESRFSKKERIVGITSVFRGDGGYLLSNLSNAVSMARYGEALTESLQATLQRVRTEMNWLKGDSVRVIVHAFKPMRNTEVESLKVALAEFSEFDLQFAFLHVKEDHPYLLFDDQSVGVKGRGEKTPVRGLYAEIGANETLLTLTGPQQLKRATDGLPKPLLLSLHRDSTFTDIIYLTKQVFWFSNHSWRSFLPAAMPVTIYYSDLVAGLLGRLDRLGSRWSPSVMLGKIGTTRWFL